ncbi:hypothetical protein SOVF_084810 [Spinacia oleracea]|uniref:SWIM-type domain-containing protein n=1 Tax=Spinacia oleracea TaxID=3562 RepID=A0ABM3R939_SPIOL|nr:uncharacterized protein LOC130467594 [Spinacia oleracea]KNA16921.1 hypothetical protein SOVF_084810 [Spinacia oleracea]
MASTGVGDGGLLFRGFFEGSISGSHFEIDKRPYHKNCTCALHGSSGTANCPHQKPPKVSYPIKRSWSEGSLAMYSSLNPSPSSSPASVDHISKGNGTPPLPRTSSSSTLHTCPIRS